MYDVLDVTTNKYVLKNGTNEDVRNLLGISSSQVCTYAQAGHIRLDRYAIIRTETGTEKDMLSECSSELQMFYNLGFKKEWEAITSFIRNRVEWCEPNTPGARRIVLKPNNML